jgi:hypothetical protein
MSADLPSAKADPRDRIEMAETPVVMGPAEALARLARDRDPAA